jgi:hypothetical protein
VVVVLLCVCVCMCMYVKGEGFIKKKRKTRRELFACYGLGKARVDILFD